jgi:anti-anti-sigma regulatory factor
MAESLSMLLRQEFKRRLVLELDGLEEMPEDFVGELMLLHEALDKQGALLRLCGMSKEHQETLCQNDLSGHFNWFRDREEAVLGFYRPSKPR